MKRRNCDAEFSQTTKEENVTTIMISIVLIVLICHFPDRILQVIRQFSSKEHFICRKVPYYMFALTNLLVILNSSCNFIVYYVLRKSFRRILLNKLCIRDEGKNYDSDEMTQRESRIGINSERPAELWLVTLLLTGKQYGCQDLVILVFVTG